MLPQQIRNFIDVFAKLPGIGPRQATRLAFFLIGSGKSKINEAARGIIDLASIKVCTNCFFIHSNEGSLCGICENPHRVQNIIMIVEKETDLMSIERTRRFNGRYLIIGELTKGGILDATQKLRMSHLKNIIGKKLDGQADEVIIATNPTTYGDLNAMVIKNELEGYAKKFTRLGRGIPTGGEIEFADEDTLEQALERRI
ncbi:MAG: Recombination protein RecR [Candidatus Wolfebacteria bacterium GW2011_GWE1_48_7]|uniref:Recombination protein RecR n=2 Tax=Candidatus Wolfeibacteriota TaxID=1752735 RepID=A0A0G1X7B9_9BACT|nr:MAG: Recombinational DNA repair protein, recombination protein RecR [Candidatus Wolfebacteria bacterium GW2011_GWB1_47_1]KKU36984.1 MAG: Recombination protein RecR [Candidatus Wolfebacteria bacterium GW2011_GWC2_46_275]KKU42522.1 MAG: Recombination protein RecR [Candidatus Wolfebacteria bacterium GW2011_GWB2_46_69]KKU53899.1 MAG: Recombination protein RecR [Candidatus Wolfebacteria bacterium GW2011_GWC1_47_103]KKU59675.1 MAG: Recombination protein RecR [Candidatus Wolfebacteria bacterium GW2